MQLRNIGRAKCTVCPTNPTVCWATALPAVTLPRTCVLNVCVCWYVLQNRRRHPGRLHWRHSNGNRQDQQRHCGPDLQRRIRGRRVTRNLVAKSCQICCLRSIVLIAPYTCTRWRGMRRQRLPCWHIKRRIVLARFDCGQHGSFTVFGSRYICGCFYYCITLYYCVTVYMYVVPQFLVTINKAWWWWWLEPLKADDTWTRKIGWQRSIFARTNFVGR